MYRSTISLLAAAAAAFAVAAFAAARPMPAGATQPPHEDAQKAELRDTVLPGGRMPEADSLLIIDWRPPFIDMERIEYATPYGRGDTLPGVVIRVVMPRHALDAGTVTIWRAIINNGSMGNWPMPYPAGYIDARTLSFPPP